LNLDGVIDKLKDNVCNRTIDMNFRMTILRCMDGILRHNPEKSKEMAAKLYDSLKDYDQSDVQVILGKNLSKLWLKSNELIIKCDELMEKSNAKEGIELNVKRNMAIYLHQMVALHGSDSKELQARFIQLQQIFLKFLFDRRGAMQDLASKSLTQIYNLGDETVK